MSDDGYIEEVPDGLTYGEKLLSTLSVMIVIYEADMPNKVREKLEKLMEIEIKGLKATLTSNAIVSSINLKNNQLALKLMDRKQVLQEKRKRILKVVKIKGNKPGDKDDSSDS